MEIKAAKNENDERKKIFFVNLTLLRFLQVNFTPNQGIERKKTNCFICLKNTDLKRKMNFHEKMLKYEK